MINQVIMIMISTITSAVLPYFLIEQEHLSLWYFSHTHTKNLKPQPTPEKTSEKPMLKDYKVLDRYFSKVQRLSNIRKDQETNLYQKRLRICVEKDALLYPKLNLGLEGCWGKPGGIQIRSVV